MNIFVASSTRKSESIYIKKMRHSQQREIEENTIVISR